MTHLQTQGTLVNWEYFEVAFLDKYYPRSARTKKKQKFVHLQEGGIYVVEYVAMFERLAKFCPHDQYAPNEEWRLNQFEWGLMYEIR